MRTLAIKTLEQQLEDVQSAISAAEQGIEYSIGGRRVRRSELPALYAREKDLMSRIASQQNSSNDGSGMVYVQWGRS